MKENRGLVKKQWNMSKNNLIVDQTWLDIQEVEELNSVNLCKHIKHELMEDGDTAWIQILDRKITQ